MQRALSGSRTGPRKQPPHQVEVEAAEQSISRICHKICLPNDTSEVSPCPRDPAARSWLTAQGNVPHLGYLRTGWSPLHHFPALGALRCKERAVHPWVLQASAGGGRPQGRCQSS